LTVQTGRAGPPPVIDRRYTGKNIASNSVDSQW
jgi:hypothetical protein